jgi:hypothetical protein
VVLVTQAGCGGSSCPVGLVDRLVFHDGIAVGCCGASSHVDFSFTKSDAELDLAFHKPAGPTPLVHAWLTTPDCDRLFDGDYPQATGRPVPLCTAHLGPVSAGEVSPRRELPPGTYRLWVQAFSTSPEPQTVFVDVGIWGPQCDRPPL